MGLTSSLFTALSGLNVNQLKLDVTGNNIANVNTTAFKSSTVSFQSQFSQTFSFGAPPSGTTGGANPTQIGLGAVAGAIQRNMEPGSFESTGKGTDLAIEGKGWFIVEKGDGSQAYTRDGAFVLNGQNYLVSGDGYFLEGFGVDSNFNVVTGTLTRLQVPIGQLSVAGATSNADYAGNLNSSGVVATTAAVLASQALTDAGNGGAAAVESTDLTDVRSGTDAIFAVGDELTLNTEKGGRDLPSSTFTVTSSSTSAINSGSTVGEFMEWLQDVLGINTDTSTSAGVTIDSTGHISVVGNIGTVNDLDIQVGDLLSTNSSFNEPLTFTKSASADGESVYTSMTFYDSLGTEITAGISMVLESRSGLGTTWRWFAESPDDTDIDLAVGTGQLTFGNQGQLLTVSGNSITINRDSTGAETPLNISADFSTMTALAADDSSIVMSTQDGFPVGTLSDFAFGPDGSVVGTFTNGLTKTLGQLALATFANDSGLVAESDNLFSSGPNSGVPVVRAPLTGGVGKIASGALELSNVDLSREFINLIVASTGFSAASRVINSSNQLLTELLQTVR
ncbi:MAG: hypothetical protein BIFFINMI_03029 [Phycisphaerae bacterium]|nr:hypothetical protein [Phycisphaerae bacterium]